VLDSLLADLPILLVAFALALHVLGERRAVRLRRRPRGRRARWRAVSFYGGLVTILVALEGPVDSYAARLFWVHMIQHVLLLSVAAPLIVLGDPWMSIWRPLPLGLRRAVAGDLARSGWAAPLRAAGGALGSPAGSWLAFSINLAAWHVPVLYDLTLTHLWVHILEHTTFLTFSILLWAQVIHSPPLRLRLSAIGRVYYMTAANLVGWAISLVLAFSPRPLYPVYVHIADRPGGISALVDQQLAAGVMLVLGSLSTVIFVFVGLYRWLGLDGDAARRASSPRPSAAGPAG
jgi:cytochrome c oxidase assembly factor CtaG